MRIPGRLIRGSVRPDRRSLARFASLRWAALPIVDRRWTAPMSAVALGFGLFVGVAIGPGTEGSLGTTNPMVIEVPAPANPQTASAPPDSGGGGGGDGGDNANHPAGGGTPPADPPAGDSSPVFDTPTTTPSYPETSTPPVTSYPTTTTDETTTGGTTTDDATTTDDEASGEPATETLAGTVVHLNPEAASYTIATDDRRLLAVHSRATPTVGRVVEVEARQLANGTYDETGNRDENGKRGRVSFDGMVSFSNPVTGVYTVSAPGVSVLVRGGAQRTPPDVGEQVEVQVRIADNVEALPVTTPGEQGCGNPPALPKAARVGLEQVGLKRSNDEETTATDVEAIVEGVCRDSRKLIVSADDVRESGHDTAIAVPDELKIGALKPGQVLKLAVEIGDGGALRLTAAANDKGTKGAEGEDLVQPGADSETSDEG